MRRPDGCPIERLDTSGLAPLSLVKVLNGCGVNNHYWVFAGGLTNVRVVLTVEDTVAHVTHTNYVNPQGTAYAPIQDTSAFATCP